MQSPNASIPPCGAPPSWRAGRRAADRTCGAVGRAAGWRLADGQPGRTAVSASRRGRDPPAAPGPVPAGDTASDRAGAAPHAPNIVSWMSWRLDPRQLLWVCPENRRTRSGPPSRSSGTAAAAPCSAGCPRSAPNRCAGCIWRPRPATCCSSPCVRPPPPPTPRPLAAGAGARAGRTVRPYPQAPGPACDTPLHVGLEPGAFETPARHAPLDRRLPALPAAGRHTPALA